MKPCQDLHTGSDLVKKIADKNANK
jgi:hypothetical protein